LERKEKEKGSARKGAIFIGLGARHTQGSASVGSGRLKSSTEKRPAQRPANPPTSKVLQVVPVKPESLTTKNAQSAPTAVKKPTSTAAQRRRAKRVGTTLERMKMMMLSGTVMMKQNITPKGAAKSASPNDSPKLEALPRSLSMVSQVSDAMNGTKKAQTRK
jgi:hypothetical protein